jgi:hypothetical protein
MRTIIGNPWNKQTADCTNNVALRIERELPRTFDTKPYETDIRTLAMEQSSDGLGANACQWQAEGPCQGRWQAQALTEPIQESCSSLCTNVPPT